MQKEENKMWESDIKDWTLVSKEMADLMVRECELALAGSIDSCETIINRSDKLIALYIPICTALAIYILPKLNDLKIFSSLLLHNSLYLSAFLCFIASIVGIVPCLLNAKSYVIRGVGSDPAKIVSTEYIDNSIEGGLKYINISLSICENAKLRMDKNNQIAFDKSKLNNISVYTLFAFPVCPIVVYLIHLLIPYQ